MIVWGEEGAHFFDTGGRYNASTDSWTATSTTNAPAPGGHYTAVWTGSEMIVWGGHITGAKYCAYVSPQLGNISTRAFVQTGDNVVIGGFIVQGTETKRVIIRAIGPELTQYGVPNALANPTLELHDGTGVLIASNNNWATTIIGGIITANQVHDIQASGHAPGDGLESAIIADLPAGNYTAIVRGVNDMTGVSLVEVYDLSPETSSNSRQYQDAQLCADGRQRDDRRFHCSGNCGKESDCARDWPFAHQYGVPNVLANPTLELHNVTGALIASNNNWANDNHRWDYHRQPSPRDPS